MKTIAFVLLVSCLYLPITFSVKINHMRKAIHPNNEFFQMGEMQRRPLHNNKSNRDSRGEKSNGGKAVNANTNSNSTIANNL